MKLGLGVWWAVMFSWLAAGGAGCDQLKAGGATASAEPEEAADGEQAEEGTKKKRRKKKADPGPEETGPEPIAPSPNAPTADPGGVPLPPAPAPAAPVSAFNYFGDSAASIPAKFKERFPQGARVLEVNVQKTYVLSQVQDPNKKINVDKFTLREGLWREPEPVKLIGKATEESISAEVFDVNEVAFAELPRIASDVLARANVEQGEVSHFMIKRPLPFDKEVRIRVFVRGPRKNAWADYDKKGVFKKLSD